MRKLLASAGGAALLASCIAVDTNIAVPAAPWRPTPVANAVEPSEVVKNAPASAWRQIDPNNLLVMDLKNGGRIAVELAPDFAPVHVANIRAFARHS